MSKTSPKLPKGTRDFEPATLLKRQYIISQIKSTFEQFGFLPLETPAMENLSVLTGKYGDEGDQLLFKILNSGDFLSKSDENDRSSSESLMPKIAEKGLRYDLTVPFARFVSANRHELTFPFKRYQIQPVWRADRPQKGRYREFLQCDADVVGTTSLLCEAEIVQMINLTFDKLGIENYKIRFNHREVLRGISDHIGLVGRESDLTVAIDKLDKIGWEGVQSELLKKNFQDEQIEKAKSILLFSGNNDEKIQAVENLNNEAAKKGAEDINVMISLIENMGGSTEHCYFDLSLARGLSYYTGLIFEVSIDDVSIGSVSGGGRYDNLTDVFGLKDMTGVGFSFGIDRLYDAMEELGLLNRLIQPTTQVLIVHFDQDCFKYGLGLLGEIRADGIAAEIYPEMSKLKKQLQYADKKSIPYVLFVGSEEIKQKRFTVRRLSDGEEKQLAKEELKNFINLT